MQNLSKNEKLAFWISSCCTFLTYKKQLQVLTELSNNVDCFNKSENMQLKLMQIVDKKSYNSMMLSLDENIINNYLRNLSEQGISIITIFSDNYPKLLKEISCPPIILYAKGNLDCLSKPCVSIVGTRRCTKYGKEITGKISSELSLADIVIVSGLADGVDTIAHQSAVNLNKSTIAVLGCGINTIYPASNIELANRITEKGLIISEYQPNEKPQTYYFPMRNRIIAGLSKALIVTEAPLKSGALITKDYAMECNRDVFAVPGRINDVYSSGCNQIIKDCQANMLLNVENVLAIYGKSLNSRKSNEMCVQLSINEELVYNLLLNNDLHYHELIQQTNLEPKIINTVLMQLEIKGIISKLPGNVYSKIRR